MSESTSPSWRTDICDDLQVKVQNKVDKHNYARPQNTHQFLLRGPDGDADIAAEPIDIAGVLREAMAEWPETKATFNVSDLDVETAHAQQTDEIVEFCGGWMVPEWLPANLGYRNRYVAPSYVHGQTYSDVAVYCRCGALCGDGDGCHPYTEAYDHNICRDAYRDEYRDRLWTLREWYIRRLGQMGWTYEQIATRLGTTRDRLVNFATERLGINGNRLQSEHRRLRARTMATLLAQGYSKERIAGAYGVSTRVVRDDTRDPMDVGVDVERNYTVEEPPSVVYPQEASNE